MYITRRPSHTYEAGGVAVMNLKGKSYAFIGLERIGGVMMYDITGPEKSTFIDYQNTRDFSEDVKGDSGPEGLAVVNPKDNPYNLPLLFVSYEVSGTVGAFRINEIKMD